MEAGLVDVVDEVELVLVFVVVGLVVVVELEVLLVLVVLVGVVVGVVVVVLVLVVVVVGLAGTAVLSKQLQALDKRAPCHWVSGLGTATPAEARYWGQKVEAWEERCSRARRGLSS